MKPAELALLNNLVSRFRAEAEKLSAESAKVYKTAGYSYEEGGTGDEGWTKAFSLGGETAGYLGAAQDLERLIKQFKTEE
jgi:hypothetical protein